MAVYVVGAGRWRAEFATFDILTRIFEANIFLTEVDFSPAAQGRARGDLSLRWCRSHWRCETRHLSQL